jgi:hypothetical protein
VIFVTEISKVIPSLEMKPVNSLRRSIKMWARRSDRVVPTVLNCEVEVSGIVEREVYGKF